MATKSKRKPLSVKTRFEVFKRDGFKCMYCNAHPPAVVLHVDHIVAVAAGGGNEIDNLVTACAPCNLGKGARDLSVAPQSLADKAADIQEREAQLLGYQAVAEARRDRIDAEVWRVLRELFGQSTVTVPREQFNSVRMFVEKIGMFPTLEAAEIALGSSAHHSKVFRYFCGVCWNKIKRAQDHA